MNYIQLKINVTNEVLQELVIALLADNNFNGFETTENYVLAYIDESDYSEHELKKILQPLQLSYTAVVMEKQNWNQVWESNFSPVVVDDFVAIRANFHQTIQNVEHEIVITPKMSFGTGHHATTFSVIQLMKEIDFKNKSVFDFGTGTGILAILAEKLGASNILAVDNDDWCIENSLENIQTNQCKTITIKKADSAQTPQQFNVVIANINKHIILSNFQNIHHAVLKNGIVILSGLLVDDEEEIIAVAKQYHWQHIRTKEKNNWIALYFNVNNS
jgi:ribosomal protein L11 methyltransferase